MLRVRNISENDRYCKGKKFNNSKLHFLEKIGGESVKSMESPKDIIFNL